MVAIAHRASLATDHHPWTRALSFVSRRNAGNARLTLPSPSA